MKRILCYLFSFVWCALIISNVTAMSGVQVTTFSAQERLKFIPNQGQWDDKALYQTRSGKHTTWFASDGAYHQFFRSGNKPSRVAHPLGCDPALVPKPLAGHCRSGLAKRITRYATVRGKEDVEFLVEIRNANLQHRQNHREIGIQAKRQRPSKEYF